jgi:hypothetical protein
VDSNSRTNSFQPEEVDAGQFKSKQILLKGSYLVIAIWDEDNLGGVRKHIQRTTKSYFMKIF